MKQKQQSTEKPLWSDTAVGLVRKSDSRGV